MLKISSNDLSEAGVGVCHLPSPNYIQTYPPQVGLDLIGSLIPTERREETFGRPELVNAPNSSPREGDEGGGRGLELKAPLYISYGQHIFISFSVVKDIIIYTISFLLSKKINK